MPVIHIYTPEGFVSPARKRALVERVTAAAVEAEGVPTTDLTYVLVHEVADGGWGWQGDVITRADFAPYLPPDPPHADPTDSDRTDSGVTGPSSAAPSSDEAASRVG